VREVRAVEATVLVLTGATFCSTLGGGLVALRHRARLPLILGFTAGVLLGVVAFDLLPEIMRLVAATATPAIRPMVALVAAFLLFHVLEQGLVLRRSRGGGADAREHPSVGIAAALALIGHSFLDGVGIGIAFQVSSLAGVAVALAVIAHDFSDGLNTVSLLLLYRNPDRRAFRFLLADALAPLLGACSTLLFTLPDAALVLYLGFFVGFLLHIATVDTLPRAHAARPSLAAIGMTLLGTAFLFAVTRFT
jgi:zinc transporter ZupT